MFSRAFDCSVIYGMNFYFSATKLPYVDVHLASLDASILEQSSRCSTNWHRVIAFSPPAVCRYVLRGSGADVIGNEFHIQQQRFHLMEDTSQHSKQQKQQQASVVFLVPRSNLTASCA